MGECYESDQEHAARVGIGGGRTLAATLSLGLVAPAQAAPTGGANGGCGAVPSRAVWANPSGNGNATNEPAAGTKGKADCQEPARTGTGRQRHRTRATSATRTRASERPTPHTAGAGSTRRRSTPEHGRTAPGINCCGAVLCLGELTTAPSFAGHLAHLARVDAYRLADRGPATRHDSCPDSSIVDR